MGYMERFEKLRSIDIGSNKSRWDYIESDIHSDIYTDGDSHASNIEWNQSEHGPMAYFDDEVNGVAVVCGRRNPVGWEMEVLCDAVGRGHLEVHSAFDDMAAAVSEWVSAGPEKARLRLEILNA